MTPRHLFCLAIVLVAAVCGAFGDEKPITNPAVRKAKAAYDAEVAKAKAAYIEQLDEAIKKAGAAGDLEEANRIAAEKKRVGGGELDTSKNPDELRKRLEATTWTTSPKEWLRFGENGEATNNRGTRIVWTAAHHNTVLIQSGETLNIYVWQFDKDLRTGKSIIS